MTTRRISKKKNFTSELPKVHSHGRKKEEEKTSHFYTSSNNPMEFYVSEQPATYEASKPYTVFYDNPEHSLRLLKGDSVAILNQGREDSVDMIFADPPYFLSNGGISCHAGKMVSVNKGDWDKSRGTEENHKFVLEWLKACQRVLKPNGTIWVSGTTHIIYSIGYAMQELCYKILNDIVWFKRNAAPNLSCRYFTHSTEIVLWAAKNAQSKHYFNYELMKKINYNKQMRNVWEMTTPESEEQMNKIWEILTPTSSEKKFGKHPTQKPLKLLERIILASTKEGDMVLDPFCGSSTTGVAALLLNRKYVGIDKEEEYLQLSVKRLQDTLSEKKSHVLIALK